MSFWTALSLSVNNLLTKKARTILTSFAGSIGIIGIALIMSVSTGVQAYIDSIERSTMASYPITISETTMDTSAMLSAFMNSNSKENEVQEENTVYSNDVVVQMMESMTAGVTTNNLRDFKTFLDSSEDIKNDCYDIKYTYSTGMNVYLENDDGTYTCYDRDMNILLTTKYDIQPMENGYMAYLTAENGRTGVIGKDGKVALEAKYEFVSAMSPDGYFVSKLAELAGVAPEQILSYDLCIYNAEKPVLCGFDEDFLTSPRLDNITSAFAVLYGIVNCNRAHGVTAAVLFDNEEVGSGTKQGADSATLGLMLEKIACALGASRSEYIDSLASGFMLSCDVAHAKHPNHAELSDASCNAVMNKGTALKMNYEQRYATEAVGIGMIEGICAKYSIPYQRFMNRPDLRGGGTLGSFAASQLGMSTADVGVPMLAMHSCRETMGVRDQDSLNELVAHYFAEE